MKQIRALSWSGLTSNRGVTQVGWTCINRDTEQFYVYKRISERFRNIICLTYFYIYIFLQFCCSCNHSIYCKTSLKITFWRMSAFEIKWQWANGVFATMIANHPIYELVIQWLGHWAGWRAAKIVNYLRGETVCTSFMIGLLF